MVQQVCISRGILLFSSLSLTEIIENWKLF